MAEVSQSQTPFFVVGTGRCGTTMFRKLLQKHRHVHLPRETHWIPLFYHSYGFRKVPVTELIEFAENVYMAKGFSVLERIYKRQNLDTEEFKKAWIERVGTKTCNVATFLEVFYRLLAEQEGAMIYGDKTPDYGQCMAMIQDIWPDAKFVHIYRDGRDVALSMSKVLSFRVLAVAGINHWWSVAYKKTYEKFLTEAKAEQPIDKFFSLWHSRVCRTFDESDRIKPGSYMQFRYEELLANPDAMLRKVGEFLDFPDDPKWVERAVKDIRRGNLNKNLENPDYQLMTQRFGPELTELGFTP